jgi:hypothetical protein
MKKLLIVALLSIPLAGCASLARDTGIVVGAAIGGYKSTIQDEPRAYPGHRRWDQYYRYRYERYDQ